MRPLFKEKKEKTQEKENHQKFAEKKSEVVQQDFRNFRKEPTNTKSNKKSHDNNNNQTKKKMIKKNILTIL